MKTEPNKPAFTQSSDYNEQGMIGTDFGLTKREYFAAMAISSGKSAKESVILADELIQILNDEGLKKINEQDR